MHERRVGERGIRRAPGHDDVRLLPQRLDDRFGAEVRVRGGHPVADGGERLARLHVAEFVSRGEEVVERVHQVVARDHRHPGPARQRRVRERESEFGPAPLRVHPARVRDHADLLLEEVGDEVVHQGHEVARVAGGRIPVPLLLHDRHRDLGQVVEHQVVDRAAPHLQLGRLLPVSPEPLSGGDAHTAVAMEPGAGRERPLLESHRGGCDFEREGFRRPRSFVHRLSGSVNGPR